VSVDECGIDGGFYREYGRALRGQKVESARPGKRPGKTNVVGALCHGKHLSVTSCSHSINAGFFEQWFKEALLHAIPKGSAVILDNARYHRKAVLEGLAKKKKVRILFLPAYSPDYNPIEKSWANMKRYLRDNAHDFQSVDSAVQHYFWKSNFLS
jgi:transposase